MAGKITVYNNLRRLGSTSEAFNITKVEELMREYTLSFSIVNTNPIFKFIGPGNVYMYHGQKYDVSSIDGESGDTNTTQISAEHISYRLSDYTLAKGYSFVGTIRELAEDILSQAKLVDGTPANTVFNISSCIETESFSYALKDSTNITAREALIGLSRLGIEIEFDNLDIIISNRRGKDTDTVFKYGHSLAGVHRTWQKGNGWSYDINIADLQKIPGSNENLFSIGDTVTVVDEISGTTITDRVIRYVECDDPSQNSITVGVFVLDDAQLSIQTDRVANLAKNKADTSVQLGERYSNVSIDHTDGFKAENRDGNRRVMMNADDCFIVQIYENEHWNTVSSLEEFGLLVSRLTTQSAKNRYYATIGTNSLGNVGLFLYAINDEGNFQSHLEFWKSADKSSVVESKSGDLSLMAPPNGKVRFERKGKGTYGIDGDVDTGTLKLKFTGGIIESTDKSDSGISIDKGNNCSVIKSNDNLLFTIPSGKKILFRDENENDYGMTGVLKIGVGRFTFYNGLLIKVEEE